MSIRVETVSHTTEIRSTFKFMKTITPPSVFTVQQISPQAYRWIDQFVSVFPQLDYSNPLEPITPEFVVSGNAPILSIHPDANVITQAEILMDGYTPAESVKTGYLDYEFMIWGSGVFDPGFEWDFFVIPGLAVEELGYWIIDKLVLSTNIVHVRGLLRARFLRALTRFRIGVHIRVSPSVSSGTFYGYHRVRAFSSIGYTKPLHQRSAGLSELWDELTTLSPDDFELV